jgi:hypothetical protein
MIHGSPWNAAEQLKPISAVLVDLAHPSSPPVSIQLKAAEDLVRVVPGELQHSRKTALKRSRKEDTNHFYSREMMYIPFSQ